MSYSNGILSSPSAKGQPGPPGKPGVPGVGYKLTADGNFDIDTKRLTNLAESVDDNDAVSLKVLKEHTQVSQNNYHLQPSFKIYKEFGDKSQLTVGTPPNTPSNHFFNNHKAHHDPYIVDKEADDTGFSGEAWSSMKLKGNQLESGSYTVIFEIFVISPNNLFLSDDTIIYHVYGDSHYSITTFNSNKINGQYTRSMIQFTTDGGAGVDDGIKFQIKYFGSQYNNNIKFLFYSRVIKGSQSTSFDHAIFNVSDVQDNHTILYFKNLNLNGNLINGLSDPVDNNDATNKIYVDLENTKQNIAIADKASKSYVDNQIANVQIDTTPLLPRDGSREMFGDLKIGDKHILNVKNVDDHQEDDGYVTIVKDLRSVVNKGYLNEKFLKKINKDGEEYFDLKQNIIKNCEPYYDGLFDNNSLVSKAFVDAEINKLPKQQQNVLHLDGSKAMTGDLDMGMKKILYLDSLNDYTNNSEKDKDLKSAVNKEYLNTHFLKIIGKGDYDFNLGGQIIKNCEPYYDGLFDDNSLVSKAFVDAEIKKIPSVDTDVLKIDGSKAMAGDINMANNSIINLKEPGASDSNHAASVKFVNTIVNNSNTIISTLIDKKIKESEEASISSVSQENVFKKVMTDNLFKENDDRIEFLSTINYNLLHLINHETYLFRIKKDRPNSYNARLSIDLRYLPTGTYTMAFEMKFVPQIDQNNVSVNAESGTLNQVTTKTRTINFDYGYYSRSIIGFHKWVVNPGIDDLDIDLQLPIKSSVSQKPDKTPINVIVYGVRGTHSDIPIQIWDRYFYIDNKKTYFEAPIDMNGKDITGVNKITTADLDVNSQIDMKGNKIIRVGDGTSNNDAVNKIQLDAKVATVNNKIIQIRNDINTILNSLTKLKYYYFTDQLKHNNDNTVKFPAVNSHPFSADNNSEFLKIELDGHYQIIYTDFFIYDAQFIIHDNTNGNDLFVINLDGNKSWTPITINTVIPITVDNGFNYARIKMYLKNKNLTNAIFDGTGNSTFHIKYLHT